MNRIYPAIFTPFSDGSGGYAVEFPDLPGCVTGGTTMQEAIDMAWDAANGWILVELESGNPVPDGSDPNDICNMVKKGQLVQLIAVDTDLYKEMIGE